VYFARWGFTHLAQVALAFVATALALELAWRPAEGAGASVLLARGVALFLPACALAVVLARRVEPEGARGLGLRPDRNLRAVGLGLAGYALLLPAILGVGWLWPWLLERLGGEWREQVVVTHFLAESGAALWAAIGLAVLVQPFLEELLFRGFLQPLLVQNFHDRPGVALTALAFAGLHGTSSFLPILALSLVLGAVQLRTQRLAAAWAVHATHNGLMLALVLGWEPFRELLPEASSLLVP
jgi:membrane protease YdiL (CAAX protease family)